MLGSASAIFPEGGPREGPPAPAWVQCECAAPRLPCGWQVRACALLAADAARPLRLPPSLPGPADLRRVLGMVPHVHGGGAPSGEAVTILQYDFFTAFAALAPALVALLARAAPDAYEASACLRAGELMAAASSAARFRV